MIKVYTVDGSTRLHLPSSAWANQVLTSLMNKGHDIQEGGDAPIPDDRSPEELARRDALLEETGL